MKLSIDIQDNDIAGLLVAGFEGGINYWGRITDYITPSEPKPILDQDKKNAKVWKHCDYPLHKDGAVIIEDKEEGEGKQYVLDINKIKKGLQIMAEKYPRHFDDFMNQDYDATTGDVFIQCCLLGKVIYG